MPSRSGREGSTTKQTEIIMLFDKLTRLTDAEKARLFDRIIAVLSEPYSLFSEGGSLFSQSSGCSDMFNNINKDIYITDKHTTTTTTLQNYDEVCREWLKTFAEMCKSYPAPVRLTDRRRDAILARIQEDSFTLDDFRAACRNMEKSDWIKSRGFGSFDWIIANADNLAKLAEGYYNRKDGKAADPVPAERPPLTGRAALLEKYIADTAAHFGKSGIDARAIAESLKATMDADRYYKQLEDVDLERIFHNGKSRKYEYFGQITPSLFCEWFNQYKEDWRERLRRANMVR